MSKSFGNRRQFQGEAQVRVVPFASRLQRHTSHPTRPDLAYVMIEGGGSTIVPWPQIGQLLAVYADEFQSFKAWIEGGDLYLSSEDRRIMSRLYGLDEGRVRINRPDIFKEIKHENSIE